MAASTDNIQITLTGRFPSALPDQFSQEPDVEVGLSSGLGGERIVELVSKAGAPLTAALAGLKGVVNQLLHGDQVTSVSITRAGVSIGSMRARDAATMKEFILETLNRLEEHKSS